MNSEIQLNKTVRIELESIDGDSSFHILDGQSRICNWLYNDLLDKAESIIKEVIQTGDSKLLSTVYSSYGLRNLVPELKKEKPFLKTVYSSHLKNTALRLADAIKTHKNSKKVIRKGKVGWPKHRSWKKKWFSLFYEEPNKGYKVDYDKLRLSFGVDKNKKRISVTLKLKEAHLLLNQKTKNLRIVKEYGKYYAIFTIKVPIPEKKPVKRIIALDPNHKNLVYGVDSDGKSIEVEAPHYLKRKDKMLDELKSKRDRCQRKAHKVEVVDETGKPTGKIYYNPSRRWKKLDKTLEKAHRVVRDQKKNYMYTVAHKLCRNYDYIGIGDYTPNGNGITTSMRRAMNNRSLNGQFKETLSWVAMKSGKTFVVYNEKGTTRTCHACGYVVQEGLLPSIRQWTCQGCCSEHIRDENAAINGLRIVLRDIQIKKEEAYVSLVPCSGLVSIKEQCAWRVLPSGVVTLCGGKNGMNHAALRN